jgi:CBS domain-containing protein
MNGAFSYRRRQARQTRTWLDVLRAKDQDNRRRVVSEGDGKDSAVRIQALSVEGHHCGNRMPDLSPTLQRAHMNIVAQILKSKPAQTAYTIAPVASVFDAIELMAQKNIGGLVVMEGERVVGIITERDYARKIALMARSSRETPVRDIMTSPVTCVRPDQTSEECMVLMTEKRLRHLPVIDRGKLIGLVSIGDLVKDIISQQKFVIEQLERYIHGERGDY